MTDQSQQEQELRPTGKRIYPQHPPEPDGQAVLVGAKAQLAEGAAGEVPLRAQVRRAARDLEVMRGQLHAQFGDRLRADSAEALAVLAAVAVSQLARKCQSLRAAMCAYPARSLAGRPGPGGDSSRDGQSAARLRLLTVATMVSRPVRRLLEVLDDAE